MIIVLSKIISVTKKMKKLIHTIIFITIFILCVFAFFYLFQQKNTSKSSSALINKAIPMFQTENLFSTNEILTNKDLENKFVLVNFFSSWCAPCKIEHPLFFGINKDFPNLFLLGINYKDEIENAEMYLNKEGNPYSFVGLDKGGMIGLDFGIIGLPETILINKEGKIIFKHLGPLTKKVINNEIRPFFQ